MVFLLTTIMFTIRVFPNISDDFLVSYRLAHLLRQRMLIGFSGTTTNDTLPMFRTADLTVFSSQVPEHAPSIWCGLPREFVSISKKNFAYVTSWREDIGTYTVSNMMDRMWVIGEDDFPYPFVPEQAADDRYGIFFYALSIPGRIIWETIEAWVLSEHDQPLKIMAPGQSADTFKHKINIIRKKHGSSKRCQLATPQYFTPEDLNREILSSSAIIDLRNHRGISYATLIGLSAGIPTIGTDQVCPQPHTVIQSEQRKVCGDGSGLTGEVLADFDIESIANVLDDPNIITNRTRNAYDSSVTVADLFQDLID